MYQPVSSSSKVPRHRGDPLDDMVVSAQTERYFKIRAALSFLLRGSSTPERVFTLYALPVSELDWFSEAHPQESEAWLTAYLLKILKPLTSGFFVGSGSSLCVRNTFLVNPLLAVVALPGGSRPSFSS